MVLGSNHVSIDFGPEYDQKNMLQSVLFPVRTCTLGLVAFPFLKVQ